MEIAADGCELPPRYQGPSCNIARAKGLQGRWDRSLGRHLAATLKAAQEQARSVGCDPDVVRIAPWRLHDLRRTCATGMAGIGIQPHVVEACLNHVSGAKAGVAGTYNVHSYSAEKTTALERWARHVEALVAGKPTSNVMSLPVRESA